LCLLGILPSVRCAQEKASLETLWKDYQAYGLPAPPAEARLAVLPASLRSFRNGVWRQNQHLVLLIRPARDNEEAVYWAGCDPGPRWEGMEFRPIAPEKAQIEKTTTLVVDTAHGRFPTFPDLALAIQCHAKGWKKLAEALLDRSQQTPKRDRVRRRPPRPRDDRAALALLAWNHYCNQFAWSKGDRKPIVEKLKKLLAAGKGLDTQAHRNMVADMERTLVAVKTTPGSAEAALEGLLDFDPDWGTWLGAGWDYGPRNNAGSNPHYRHLRDLGLSAVPLLLRHRDDFRLTRHIEVTSRGEYTWHLRISDVVAQLLNGLVTEPFSYGFLQRDGRGVCLDAAQVNAWWKKTQGMKELTYLLKNIEKKDAFGRLELNEPVLQALGARYPEELVKLVEKSLSGDNARLGYLVDPLADSKVAASDKGRLLVTIAKEKEGFARNRALGRLVRMRHKEARTLVIATLDKLPRTPSGESWTSDTTSIAQIAVRSDDEKLWEALDRTARRVGVGQRMQLLEGVIVAKYMKRKVLFVGHMKSLLDDKEIRDLKSSKLFEGLVAAPMYERIAVRDYAAELFAYILDLRADADPSWKEADWTALRRRVRDRLAELEKTPAKETN
jgi:hypothetical protein